MMLGANDTIYWVELSTKDEVLGDEPFSKIVRLVERSEDKLNFRDDFNEHQLSLSTGELKRTPYETDWDLENVCFVRSNIDSNTFEYVISSRNNSRKEKSITKNETFEPNVQHVTLLDDLRYYGVYEVRFTDEELHSNATFCKGISKIVKIIYYRIVQMPISTNEINSNLLKSLVG
ncbi:uncharacterized protein LOC129569698 [Sitodiplosis mosellana]|uniref:uncharacterized protein LOC129569698 n=1 Tax=Sitodiplosis mosellana TaxID=263140 RepID=UPI002443C524|nr:uncharacterized protein LOC129569698 [Sitodiplosis mosellana]